jgi:NAD(P)-dependent dehydrogenase (short-subunit alcohol dehydrogenase family)
MNMTRFDGKTVLVTGAAGNLGKAVGLAFQNAGANIALVDLDARNLRDAWEGDSPRRMLLPADLLDPSSIGAAAKAAGEKFGAIEVLCNIAGGFASGPPVHEMPIDLWHRMLDLNATSVINAVKAVVPAMIERKRGNVINVAAAASVLGQAGMSAYIAAKNAVVRLTESMAAELRPHGICVTCIMPTIIDTPQNRAAMPKADTSQWTPPSAIADVILLLASDAAMIMSGCGIRLSGQSREQH